MNDLVFKPLGKSQISISDWPKVENIKYMSKIGITLVVTIGNIG